MASETERAAVGASALYIPNKEVSPWVTETEPKEARAWLASLPLADAGNSARDLYQALYALNRVDLASPTRLELMELYRDPVATVSSLLEAQLMGLALPLPPASRQAAEFVRQLQMEMAIGYKCAFQDLLTARLPWGRRNQVALATERAMSYLGEVLRRSYRVYMPPPPGVWKEIHALYRYAEEHGGLEQPVEVSPDKTVTIAERYRQILLLGLCNPYQLPQNEITHVSAFLETWAEKAVLSDNLNVPDPVGHFLVDLANDAPPMPMAQQAQRRAAAGVRVLNTIELARTVHGFIKRLEQGESASAVNLGADLTDAGARDMLRRMIKFWGISPVRRYTRTRTHGYLYLCTGINALHFFVSGRKPFTAPQEAREAMATGPAAGEASESILNQPDPKIAEPAVPHWLAQARVATPETYPVDRWQLRDESASGLLLAHEGEVAMHLRVGDVLGMQDTSADGWHAGVIRWIKSPEPKRIEMGVERLAPKVTAIAVRAVGASSGPGSRYVQGLLLPAMPVLQRPATLLAPRGIYESGRDLELAAEDGTRRQVRMLKLLERSASFDQIVFAERNAR